jgi:hypothetical protein
LLCPFIPHYRIATWGSGFTTAITDVEKEGNLIIVKMEGNKAINAGPLHNVMYACHLKEAILERHGPGAAATVCNYHTETPIDGIWCSESLSITAGRYLPFEMLCPRTNHRTIWIKETKGIIILPLIGGKSKSL